MHARARDLADGEEPRYGGAAVEVGDDAAHQIVRGRGHGDRLARPVESPFTRDAVDGGEPAAQCGSSQARRIQSHGSALGRRLTSDRPRHHVPWGEFAVGMAVEREAAPVVVDQGGALAPHGLGDEERGTGRQDRRMELHELEVGDRRARAQCHGDAVTGGAVRVRRVGVEVTGAAGREDHGFGRELGRRAVDQQPDAAGRSRRQEEVGEQRALDDGDGGLPHGGDERGRDRGSGGVAAGVHDTGVLVRRLTPQLQRTVRRPVEGDAAGDELGDPLGTLGDEHAHGRGIGESRAGVHRVGRVLRRRVAGAVDPRHTALRESGAAVAEHALGRERHPVTGFVRTEGRGEPRDARADDDDVHRAPATTGGFAASIRSSATRAGSATSPVTVMRFGVRPATSSSRTQAR